MQLTIDDPKTLAVIREIAWKMGVEEQEIVKTALSMAAAQYVKKPVLTYNFIRSHVKKKGVF